LINLDELPLEQRLRVGSAPYEKKVKDSRKDNQREYRAQTFQNQSVPYSRQCVDEKYKQRAQPEGIEIAPNE
jgi:hypothetical protein